MCTVDSSGSSDSSDSSNSSGSMDGRRAAASLRQGLLFTEWQDGGGCVCAGPSSSHVGGEDEDNDPE